MKNILSTLVLFLLAVTPAMAQFSDANWQGLTGATGPSGSVNAVTVDAAGNLYVGGSFAILTGGSRVNGIAMLDGLGWQPVSSGFSSGAIVNALVSDPFGNVYAGGAFKTAGGIPATNIAVWNGSAWSALDLGLGGTASSTVKALVRDPSGHLYAGGSFILPGTNLTVYVAQWDGTNWDPVGSGVGGEVTALACDTFGHLYAGGSFTTPGKNIAEWNGTAWSTLRTGLNGAVSALDCDQAGQVYAVGAFTSADSVSGTVALAMWNGVKWESVGGGFTGVNAAKTMVFDQVGNLYLGGNLGGHVIKWDGTAWSPLGSGIGGTVNALGVDSFGNLYAGGSFATVGTTPSRFIGKALLQGPTQDQLLLNQTGSSMNVLSFLGTPDHKYALDIATNLTVPIQWFPLSTNTASYANATSSGYVSFTNANALPQSFYRTRLVR
jgi:hypothetical protein